jgi:hypothetical protein
LVAHDRHWRIERFEMIETKSAQDFGHGCDRDRELACDLRRTQALSAKLFDVGYLFRRGAAQSGGRRAAVLEGDLAARSPAPHPFANGLFAHAEISRHLRCLLSMFDAAGHLESTVGRAARIFVDVHPGPRLGSLAVGNHQFPKPAPDEQPS